MSYKKIEKIVIKANLFKRDIKALFVSKKLYLGLEDDLCNMIRNPDKTNSGFSPAPMVKDIPIYYSESLKKGYFEITPDMENLLK